MTTYFIIIDMIDTPNCRVKILTYNLFMRPPGIKNHLDDYKN